MTIIDLCPNMAIPLQVASFTGEKLAIARYNKSLTKAYKSGVQEGLATGFGFGVVTFIMLCTYALALWFGAKMVLEKGYSGGAVLNIVFAVLTGSLYAIASFPWNIECDLANCSSQMD